MEFASRFIWKGIDLSPVSFKLLVAARASTSQLPAFYDRIRGPYFRVVGAGYRVLGRVGLGYANLSKLPKRWFRLWLLIHHPRSNIGLPWLFWLSAGRTGLVPPTVLGVLPPPDRQLEADGWSLDSSVHNRLDQVPGNYLPSVGK